MERLLTPVSRTERVYMSKKYEEDFKDFVSKLVVEEGKKATDVANEMDLSPKTIYRWVKQYREKVKRHQEKTGYRTPSEYEQREKEFQDEIKELKEELEIIKKAAHIFMKSQ